MEGLASLLPFILIAAVFWFLLIRPQRKRQMELMQTQRNVEVGDEVLLGAGIVGRVASVSDDYLQLELSPGVQTRVIRGAVVRILTPDTDLDTDGPVVDPDPTRDH